MYPSGQSNVALIVYKPSTDIAFLLDYCSFYILYHTVLYYKLGTRINMTPCKNSIQVLSPSIKSLPGYKIGSNYRTLLPGEVYAVWFQTQEIRNCLVEFYIFGISRQCFFHRDKRWKCLSQVLTSAVSFWAVTPNEYCNNYIGFNMKNKIFSL